MLYASIAKYWPGVAMACLVAPGIAASSQPASADVYQVTDDGNFHLISRETLPNRNQRSASRSPKPAVDSRAISVHARRENPYQATFDRAAQKYAVSAALIEAVAQTESAYDAKAISSAKAVGIMQLMPSTARSLGVNPHDPEENIMGGTAYLRSLLDRFDGDIVRALASYNAGPEAVVKAGGVPPFAETRNYVKAVLDLLSARARRTSNGS